MSGATEIAVTAPSLLRRMPGTSSDARRVGMAVVRAVIVIAAAIVIFGAFLIAKGASPVSVYSSLLSDLSSTASMQRAVVRWASIALAALAVVVPARAGLINVGGEGQIIIGAVCGAGVALALDDTVNGTLVLLLMLVAGALGGALWAGLAAALRLLVGVNEAITTLLLNYVALDVLLYLVYAPWKDPQGSGQPTSRPLAVGARLPLLVTGGILNAGVILTAVILAVVAFLLARTTWGFRLRVVGGNPEAAKRAGLPVSRLLLTAMLGGGALAGLAGVIHFAGTEFTLRSGMTYNFGYIGFLAAWMAMHKPMRVALAALLLSALAVGADSLQIDANLPAATINVLMAVVLLVVLSSRHGLRRFS